MPQGDPSFEPVPCGYGKLRLDRGDGLAEDRGGYQVLVPGKPEESELIARIMAADPDVYRRARNERPGSA